MLSHGRTLLARRRDRKSRLSFHRLLTMLYPLSKPALLGCLRQLIDTNRIICRENRHSVFYGLPLTSFRSGHFCHVHALRADFIVSDWRSSCLYAYWYAFSERHRRSLRRPGPRNRNLCLCVLGGEAFRSSEDLPAFFPVFHGRSIGSHSKRVKVSDLPSDARS